MWLDNGEVVLDKREQAALGVQAFRIPAGAIEALWRVAGLGVLAQVDLIEAGPMPMGSVVAADGQFGGAVIFSDESRILAALTRRKTALQRMAHAVQAIDLETLPAPTEGPQSL